MEITKENGKIENSVKINQKMSSQSIITKVNDFNYVALNVGYGSRFIEKNDEEPLFQDCDIDGLEIIATYGYKFVPGEGRSFVQKSVDVIYNPSEMEEIFKLTGKNFFDGSYGCIILRHNMGEKLSLSNISLIVTHLNEMHLCYGVTMDNICNIRLISNDTKSICVIDFDTESG